MAIRKNRETNAVLTRLNSELQQQLKVCQPDPHTHTHYRNSSYTCLFQEALINKRRPVMLKMLAVSYDRIWRLKLSAHTLVLGCFFYGWGTHTISHTPTQTDHMSLVSYRSHAAFIYTHTDGLCYLHELLSDWRWFRVAVLNLFRDPLNKHIHSHSLTHTHSLAVWKCKLSLGLKQLSSLK